jgi:hypothetical protein
MDHKLDAHRRHSLQLKVTEYQTQVSFSAVMPRHGVENSPDLR